MLGALGSLILFWFGSPNLHQQLFYLVSNVNPFCHIVPYFIKYVHRLDLVPVLVGNVALSLLNDIHHSSSFSKIISKIVNVKILPFLDLTTTLISGCVLFLPLLPFSSKSPFYQTYLIYKLIPALFWVTVGLWKSPDLGLNYLILISINYNVTLWGNLAYP